MVTKNKEESEISVGLAFTLKDYIKTEFENHITNAAESFGVKRQQMQQWLKREAVVVDGAIYFKATQHKK